MMSAQVQSNPVLEERVTVENLDVGSGGAVTEIHHERSNPRWTTIGALVCILVMLGLVVGLAIAFGMMLSTANKNRVNANERSKMRLQSVRDFLLENNLVEEEDLLRSNISPQMMALEWIAVRDTAVISVPDTVDSFNGREFVQRYALAVLWFSTTTYDTKWTHDLNFLTPQPVCGWYSILQYPDSEQVVMGVSCYDDYRINGLFIDRNGMTGSIPKEIGLLSDIVWIDFSFNNLVGSIPDTVNNLANLHRLQLAFNILTGSIPASLAQIPKLNLIVMDHNLFTGSLPVNISKMDQLTVMALDHNFLTGDISHIFGSADAGGGGQITIKNLLLDDNRLSGIIDDNFLVNMTQLKKLDLSNNKFAGTLPKHFFTEMKSLEILDLHNNSLAGYLPSLDNENDVLQLLALQGNQIQGTNANQDIHSSLLYNLRKQLHHLDLSRNLINSTIPIEISFMSNLRYLFLADNPFQSGIIPYENILSNLTNLEELSFKSTNRIGSIPEKLPQALNKLILLDLDNNMLSSTVPTTMEFLTDLQFLLLNRNRLNGTIPIQMGNLSKLRLLFLDENDVTGNLSVLCDRPKDDLIYKSLTMIADCGNQSSNEQSLYPGIEINCTCCVECCSDNSTTSCNDNEYVPSTDPSWQLGYNRTFFAFGERARFFALPDEP